MSLAEFKAFLSLYGEQQQAVVLKVKDGSNQGSLEGFKTLAECKMCC